TNPFSPFSDTVALYRYAGTDPLTQDVHSVTGHGGFTLNGALSDWQWSVTGNFDRAETNTYTQTGVDTGAIQAALLAGDPALNPFGPDFLNGDLYRPTDRAKSVSTSESVDTLFTGVPLDLPAGEVNTSIKLGFQNSDFDSRSTRSGLVQTSDIGRTQADGQVNIDLPIADADRGVLPWLGHFSLNANAQVQQLSDFGTLTSTGYGLNWEPVDKVRLLVSFTDEDGAPSATQLGGAVIVTPNARIFDYVTGRTVDITSISGGNPALRSDNRHVMNVTLNVQPLSDPDLRLSAEYVKERIDDPIASFPAATAAIEQAFPGRFVRDSAGNLIQVDTRPINFQRSDRQQLRWGFDFNKRLGSAGPERGPPPGAPERPRRENDAPPGGEKPDSPDQQKKDGDGKAQPQSGEQRQANQSNRRSGGRGPFGRGRGGGRLMFSAYHTIYLQNRVLIGDGLPVLDLLNGSATGNSGGQPRHEVEVRAGVFKNGYGARLSGDWKSATRVDGGTSGDQSLRFSSLATFDLRLFADLGQRDTWVANHPWLRGVRVSVAVDNIFNTRQKVTGPDGTVPISYQPGYVDPLGRTVSLSVRKLFF
ncbi:MAG: TonB-dependent receptor, partial [Sphingomonas sp.]|nr:TonB-dependent receptor [Sphingomonas sp.]